MNLSNGMIASCSSYFMKSSFDLAKIEVYKKKKKSRTPPSLFTQFYKRVNERENPISRESGKERSEIQKERVSHE